MFDPVTEGAPDALALFALVKDAIALGKTLSGKSPEEDARAIEDAHLLSRAVALVEKVRADIKS